MLLNRCEELHQAHQEIAMQYGYEFVAPVQHVSASIRREDATWSCVMKVLCAEADGKRAVHATYGIRNESVEQRFSSGPNFPTFARLVTLHPEINAASFSDKLTTFYQDLDQLIIEIDSAEALIQAVERQGAAMLVFGSWTHERSFANGRSADEIRKALR